MMLRTCQRYFQKDWLDRVFGIEGPSNTEIFLFWRKIYSNILLCLLKPKNDYVYIWVFKESLGWSDLLGRFLICCDDSGNFLSLIWTLFYSYCSFLFKAESYSKTLHNTFVQKRSHFPIKIPITWGRRQNSFLSQPWAFVQTYVMTGWNELALEESPGNAGSQSFCWLASSAVGALQCPCCLWPSVPIRSFTSFGADWLLMPGRLAVAEWTHYYDLASSSPWGSCILRAQQTLGMNRGGGEKRSTHMPSTGPASAPDFF
jgi:hypothetical protein